MLCLPETGKHPDPGPIHNHKPFVITGILQPVGSGQRRVWDCFWSFRAVFGHSTPLLVIPGHFWSFNATFGHSVPFLAIPRRFWPFHAGFVHSVPVLVVPRRFGSFPAVFGHSVPFLVIPCRFWSLRALFAVLGHSGPFLVVPGPFWPVWPLEASCGLCGAAKRPLTGACMILPARTLWGRWYYLRVPAIQFWSPIGPSY